MTTNPIVTVEEPGTQPWKAMLIAAAPNISYVIVATINGDIRKVPADIVRGLVDNEQGG